MKDRLAIAIAPIPQALEPPVPTPAPSPAVVMPVTTNVNPLALPSSMNPSVFLTRIQALRAPRDEKTKRLCQISDNPELSKTERLAKVFQAIYNAISTAKG